jgi:predicted AAA+ superfamily ATPase
MVQRLLNLAPLLEKKSFFLYGPRATGKSSLIRQQLSESCQIINLLDSEIYLRLLQNPGLLEGLIGGKRRHIVIDEIQKIPALLDQVHRLIEEKGLRFLLTGSSARKLKRGQANLLAGRAWRTDLYPLVSAEIGKIDLLKFLLYGGMPSIYLSKEPIEEVQAYVRNYLYEEIQAEGLTRNIPQFSRFLEVAALSCGQIINYTKIANDVGFSPTTIREYYQILEDTLIGFQVTPFLKTKKRKPVATSKFYLFDSGITNQMAGIKSIDQNSDLFGRRFEQFIAMELRAYNGYLRKNEPLQFWRAANYEVDFVIGEHIAIEVKATKKINSGDLKSLLALKEEKKIKNLYLVSQDPLVQEHKGISCIPWTLFLKNLWGHKIW